MLTSVRRGPLSQGLRHNVGIRFPSCRNISIGRLSRGLVDQVKHMLVSFCVRHSSKSFFGLSPRLRLGGGMLRGRYSFVACHGNRVTIDHASLSRRSTVPTPNRHTSKATVGGVGGGCCSVWRQWVGVTCESPPPPVPSAVFTLLVPNSLQMDKTLLFI